jgi:hypothetical protein
MKNKQWCEDEEEDVSSYWIILRKRGDTGNWKKDHQIAAFGELALEGAMDLSYDRLYGDENIPLANTREVTCVVFYARYNLQNIESVNLEFLCCDFNFRLMY